MKKAKKKAAQGAAAPAQPATGQIQGGLVNKQPQVKQAAAVANGMFLHADDAWSLDYFNQSSLRFKEREVFG